MPAPFSPVDHAAQLISRGHGFHAAVRQASRSSSTPDELIRKALAQRARRKAGAPVWLTPSEWEREQPFRVRAALARLRAGIPDPDGGAVVARLLGQLSSSPLSESSRASVALELAALAERAR